MVAPAQIHALVIGINEYSKYKRLKGAVSDARNFEKYLASLDIPSKNITLLVDGAATRLAITDALKSFSTDDNIEKDESAIIIFFAGHGASSIAPRSCPDWEVAGRRVEQLCPVDIGEELPDRPGCHDREGLPDQCPDHPRRIEGIPDQTIRVLLDNISKAKGNNTTLILDCCHSGGMNRDARPVEQDMNCTTRFIEDPPPISGSFDVDLFSSFLSDSGSRSLQISTEFKGMANESHILLAACSSQEYAHEGPFEFAGHFTTALLEVLRAHSFQKLTYRSLWHRLVMPPFGPPQTPHCEGKFRGRRLFDCQENGADWEDILCRRRWDRSSESVSFTLEAGEQHGVTVGSKYQIFEHDLLDGSSTVFETAKVKSTSTFTSILELVQASDAFLADSVLTDVDGSGAEDALTANPTTQRDAAASSAPNTTIAHAPNQSEGVRYARLSKDVGALLRVYCRDKAYIQSVVNEGDKGPITVVDEPDEADLVVKLDEGKVKFEHAPHTKVIEPAIVARGMSMSLLGTVAADNSESSLRCARSVVDSYGRFLKHLKRTESPPVSNILQLSFRRLQEDTLGNWEPVGKNLLNENSDTITIIPDDDSYYGLTLTNLKKLEPLFVHIFFFQPKTASIMLWYRPPQSIGFVDTVTPNSLDTALEPGRTLAAGFGNGGVHPFCFPVDPDTHIDVSIVKIFASTAPTDMSFLAQASPFKVEASVEEAEEVPFEKLSSPRNTQSLEAQFFDDADDDASSGTRTLVKRKPEGLKGNGGVQGLPAPAGFWMTRSITFIETSKPESGTPTASGEEVPAFAPVPDPQIVPQCPPKNMDIQEAPDEEGEAVAASRKVQYADQ